MECVKMWNAGKYGMREKWNVGKWNVGKMKCGKNEMREKMECGKNGIC